MINDLIYYPIVGVPFIVFLGMITIFMFCLTAFIAIMKRKGEIKLSIKWHFKLAYLSILLGIIHAILGLMLYI
jgi:hypothetical protein